MAKNGPILTHRYNKTGDLNDPQLSDVLIVCR